MSASEFEEDSGISEDDNPYANAESPSPAKASSSPKSSRSSSSSSSSSPTPKRKSSEKKSAREERALVPEKEEEVEEPTLTPDQKVMKEMLEKYVEQQVTLMNDFLIPYLVELAKGKGVNVSAEELRSEVKKNEPEVRKITSQTVGKLVSTSSLAEKPKTVLKKVQTQSKKSESSSSESEKEEPPKKKVAIKKPPQIIKKKTVTIQKSSSSSSSSSESESEKPKKKVTGTKTGGYANVPKKIIKGTTSKGKITESITSEDEESDVDVKNRKPSQPTKKITTSTSSSSKKTSKPTTTKKEKKKDEELSVWNI